jgi:hypothetical protein
MTQTKARRPIRETPFWQEYNRSRYAILFTPCSDALIMPAATTLGAGSADLRLPLAFSCLLP